VKGPRTPPEEEIRHVKRENDLLRQKREQTKKSYRPLFARPPVKFQFTAEQPNTRWVTDTKAVETAERWLYLAVILHLRLRMAVGWAMAASEDEQLVELARRLAIAQRHPSTKLLHHSD